MQTAFASIEILKAVGIGTNDYAFQIKVSESETRPYGMKSSEHCSGDSSLRIAAASNSIPSPASLVPALSPNDIVSGIF